MVITFNGDSLVVTYEGETILNMIADCVVRNEVNKWRKFHEVVKTYPRRLPYMPRRIPSGVHKIISVEWTDNPEYAPVKIRTDVERKVFVWEIDRLGNYSRQTEQTTIDIGYLIHYTKSKTTHGCIRANSEREVAKLATIIECRLRAKEDVFLEVI